jgi:hypothetical protein
MHPIKKILLINVLVLTLVTGILILSAPHMQGGDPLFFTFVMMLFNGGAILLNGLLAVILLVLRRPQAAAGAALSVLVYAILGFGLCWGGTVLVDKL